MNTEILSKDIVLENERVLLLPFVSERNTELKNIIFNDEVWKYMGMYIRNENDFNNYVQDTLTQKKNGLCYPFLSSIN
jgi:hypothetical protein